MKLIYKTTTLELAISVDSSQWIVIIKHVIGVCNGKTISRTILDIVVYLLAVVLMKLDYIRPIFIWKRRRWGFSWDIFFSLNSWGLLIDRRFPILRIPFVVHTRLYTYYIYLYRYIIFLIFSPLRIIHKNVCPLQDMPPDGFSTSSYFISFTFPSRSFF